MYVVFTWLAKAFSLMLSVKAEGTLPVLGLLNSFLDLCGKPL
jgi:hypothetical protein